MALETAHRNVIQRDTVSLSLLITFQTYFYFQFLHSSRVNNVFTFVTSVSPKPPVTSSFQYFDVNVVSSDQFRFSALQMCHQTLQGTQCTGARLYL